MRRLTPSLGSCVALLCCACTVPNPAWQTTQGLLESGSSDSLSSTSGGPGTSATVDATSGTGTQGATTSPTSATDTTASTTTSAPGTTTTDPTATTTTGTTGTTTTTTGPDSTSMVVDSDTDEPKLDMLAQDLCQVPIAPTLSVTVQHSLAPNCNAPLGPSFYGLFESKPDANTLEFRECTALGDCMQGNLQCVPKQHVSVHVDGPSTHVPKFAPGTCVHVSYLGTGYVDANTCNTRIARLARTGPDILNSSVFVAASGVPGTATLPAPWPEVLEFSVAPQLDQPCPGEQVCGVPAGTHVLLGEFSEQALVVPMKTEQPAEIPLFDKLNVKVGKVAGKFFNVRSYAHPADQCEFRWLWLADDYKP